MVRIIRHKDTKAQAAEPTGKTQTTKRILELFNKYQAGKDSEVESTTLDLKTNFILNTWFGWSISNNQDLSILARDGLDPSVIDKLLEHGFNKKESDWIIPRRTLSHRLSSAQKLTYEESAKLIRAARLVAQAAAVFGSEEKANRWLSKPKKSLRGQTPKEAMQDEFGAGDVEQLLLRIESGYF